MLTKEKAMSTDNFTARKVHDDAGAEIAQAILNFREGDIDFEELVSLVHFHIQKQPSQTSKSNNTTLRQA